MIAYCGMDCSKCEGYLATKENDDEKRKNVAEKWSIQYGADIKSDHINCTGCKAEGVKFFFTENMCPLRKCNIEKGTNHCAECTKYKCEELLKFIEMAPPVEEELEALRNS